MCSAATALVFPDRGLVTIKDSPVDVMTCTVPVHGMAVAEGREVVDESAGDLADTGRGCGSDGPVAVHPDVIANTAVEAAITAAKRHRALVLMVPLWAMTSPRASSNSFRSGPVDDRFRCAPGSVHRDRTPPAVDGMLTEAATTAKDRASTCLTNVQS
jgi:hypothetical protein